MNNFDINELLFKTHYFLEIAFIKFFDFFIGVLLICSSICRFETTKVIFAVISLSWTD